MQNYFSLKQNKGEICESIHLSLTKPIYKLEPNATLINFLITTLPCTDNPQNPAVLLVIVIIRDLYHELSSYKHSEKFLNLYYVLATAILNCVLERNYVGCKNNYMHWCHNQIHVGLVHVTIKNFRQLTSSISYMHYISYVISSILYIPLMC